jgi:hypothetical protein
MPINENQSNDDGAVTGGSNPASPANAAQQNELDKNQGTESTSSPNNAGAGNAQSNANTGSTDAPGRRLKNPLGALYSYTYQLSLYMITPDAYDAFNATGRTNIDALSQATGETEGGGAYLIAQSGGINNETSQRSPGFDLDFYIDNFKIKQAISGESTQSSTNVYSVAFDIIEPYGFSFNTKLKRASDDLQKYFQQTGYDGTIENPSRQFFIIGVKFLGYDSTGNIVSGETEFEDLGPLDPNASGNSIFQMYYDITIASSKFTIDGGATTYKMTGVALAPGKAFGTKRGRLFATKTVCGATFDDAMQGKRGLFTQLNKFERWKVTKGLQKHPNKFEIEYIGDGVESIKDARLILPTDTDKSKWCSGDEENTSDANDAESAKTVPDDAQRKIIFNADTTYIEVFDEVLKGSSYMYDALKIIYDSRATPDLATGDQPSLNPNSAKKVGWYKVTPVIKEAKWDSLLKDWAYTTIFRMEVYQTPIVTSLATNPGMDYYGPHKRYEYWWTGENREILSYQQKLDNLFYNEVLGNTNLDEEGTATGGATNVPLAPNQNPSGSPKLNSLGGGRASQNQYVTSLYSPDSYAAAKIKLLGDPDFLVQEWRGGPDDLYQRFYGDDGYRISANGGQVFIEIDFKEAIDYDNDTGVMSLNDSILMWKYPAWAEDKIKGVSYKVITVESNFSEGKFTQDLSCVINTFSDVEAGATGTNPRESAETNDASQSIGQANREEQAKSDASKQEQATDAASSEREIPISPQARTDANDDRSGT